MSKKYINESQLKSIISNHIRNYLTENYFGNESFYSESDNKDERLSDMNSETKKDEEMRDSIESFFKQPGVNCAAYAYKLYNVEASKGEDTDEMKNARSKFAKCLNHEKNESGYPYSFNSSELNSLKGMISSNQLNERINKAVNESFKKVLKEGQHDDSPITKWVYWCFNYSFPQEWIPQIWGEGAMGEHMMKKFKEAYDVAKASGAMNRFFIELDRSNQQKLIEYVMNNY